MHDRDSLHPRLGRWTAIVGTLLAAWLLPSVAFGWAISDGKPAHQWMTQEAVKYFQYQFGGSEIDSYLGTYPGDTVDNDDSLLEGVYDEDVPGENPWGQAGLNHPSVRHFWDRYPNYSRDFDDGLLGFDSAPNRAVKYFTGGSGVTGVVDTAFDDGPQGASGGLGAGIIFYYVAGGASKERAYYWLGHVVHLLQDLAVPVHAHADQHLEDPIFATAEDPDPLHDWVDGWEYYIAHPIDPKRNAAFNDFTPFRWTLWKFHTNQAAIGRLGSPTGLLKRNLRSPAGVLAIQPSLAPEVAASIPTLAVATELPLYLLFLELAAYTDNLDSTDWDGQLDAGNRRAGTGNYYSHWTQSELNGVADKTVPRGIVASAEAIRYFYSRVDSTPPVVTLPHLSTVPTSPSVTLSGTQAVYAFATETVSGVDLDGYEFEVEVDNGTGWVAFDTASSQSNYGFFYAPFGNYRVRASVENGAGLTGTSDWGYFSASELVVPTLPRAWLAVLAALLFISCGIVVSQRSTRMRT